MKIICTRTPWIPGVVYCTCNGDKVSAWSQGQDQDQKNTTTNKIHSKNNKGWINDKPSMFDCSQQSVTSPRDKEADTDNGDAESNRRN